MLWLWCSSPPPGKASTDTWGITKNTPFAVLDNVETHTWRTRAFSSPCSVPSWHTLYNSQSIPSRQGRLSVTHSSLQPTAAWCLLPSAEVPQQSEGPPNNFSSHLWIDLGQKKLIFIRFFMKIRWLLTLRQTGRLFCFSQISAKPKNIQNNDKQRKKILPQQEINDWWAVANDRFGQMLGNLLRHRWIQLLTWDKWFQF